MPFIYLLLYPKRQWPLQPQPVHPAAVWKVMQKYLLPYHRATEQFLSSGCETQFILCTPP